MAKATDEGNQRTKAGTGQGNGLGLHRGAMAKATAHRGSVTCAGSEDAGRERIAVGMDCNGRGSVTRG